MEVSQKDLIFNRLRIGLANFVGKKNDRDTYILLAKAVEDLIHNLNHPHLKKTMLIPILHTDETENEFEVPLCCLQCAEKDYGWSRAHYDVITSCAAQSKVIQKVPPEIITSEQFIDYVKHNSLQY